MTEEGLNIVLIGGGRWARVHARILSSLYPRVSRLIWISHHHRSSIESVAAKFPHDLDVQFFDSIAALKRLAPDAAVVCTSSASHAGNALSLLKLGLPVLVEKPLALNLKSALEVVNIAAQRNLTACVCLPLLKASYLRSYMEAFRGRKIVQIGLHWFDPAQEERYGAHKQVDVNTSKVDEIVPHLWSILNVLLDEKDFSVLSVAAKSPGRAVIALSSGEVRIEAHLGRRALNRIRRIELDFADEGTAVLDFAIEPGKATVDGHHYRVDQNWDREPRPLAAVITEFLDGVGSAARPLSTPNTAQQCLDSVRLSETIKTMLASREAERAAELFLHGTGHNPELIDLLIDNLGPELAASGKRIDPLDVSVHRAIARTALDSLATEAQRLPEISNFLHQIRNLISKMRRS
jgi:predicted dehydrogenase